MSAIGKLEVSNENECASALEWFEEEPSKHTDLISIFTKIAFYASLCDFGFLLVSFFRFFLIYTVFPFLAISQFYGSSSHASTKTPFLLYLSFLNSFINLINSSYYAIKRNNCILHLLKVFALLVSERICAEDFL